MIQPPCGLLVDYGGTLIEETRIDLRAGNEWLLAQASFRPPGVTPEQVVERAAHVAREVAGQRDRVHLETAWPTLARLIHDFLGIRFERPMSELELGFWQAAVRTQPLPGAREALERLHRSGVAVAVVSNTSFSERALRYELGKHGLTDHLAFIVVSSEYSIRKPNRLLFDVAAARLGIEAKDIWFIGDRLDTDMVGARGAGMTAVWFRPQGADVPPSDVDLTVRGWEEFARCVEEASARTARPTHRRSHGH